MMTPDDPMRLTPLEQRSAVSLAGIFALRMLGLFLILPVFALYAADLPGGTNALWVGLTLGIYGFTQGILQIPFGLASDRWGRKPVIVFGLVIFALGSAVAALGTDIFTVMAGRAIQGAGAISAAVTAMLADSVREKVLTRAMALVGGSIGLTFAFSLVASPLIASWIGVSGLFWITAFLSVAAIGVITRIVPAARPRAAATALPHEKWTRVVFNTDLMRLNSGIFLLHTVQMALFVVIPVRMHALGYALLDHWMIYLPAIALSFAFMMPILTFSERIGKIRELFLCAIALIALVFLALASWDSSIGWIGLLLCCFFSGFNVLEATLPSLVSKTAPPNDKGLALGVYNTTQSLGLFVGGALGGWISGQSGAVGVYIFCAALMLLWIAIAWSMTLPRSHTPGQQIDFH